MKIVGNLVANTSRLRTLLAYIFLRIFEPATVFITAIKAVDVSEGVE